MVMRLKHTLLLSVLSVAGGCGFSQDYVLKEPLEVQFEGSEQSVVLPAGTHVRRTFYKPPVAFIEVQGTTTKGLKPSSQP
jgi:outer membrane lipopolysaccharide assembly protein LptE/RlpB